MKQLFITLLIIAGSISAEARTATARDGAQGNCSTCMEAKENTASQLRGLRSAINADQSYKDLYNQNRKSGNHNVCSKFASESGWGEWGQSIIKTLNSNEFPNLFEGSSDLRAACPAYNSLSESEKKSVWITIINTMAIGESTCGVNNHAQGPNGRLVGLLQLHVGREQAYDDGCKRGDGNRPETNMKCALHMIEGQMRRSGELFSRKSYWDVLRPQARSQKFQKIKNAVRSLSICK